MNTPNSLNEINTAYNLIMAQRPQDAESLIKRTLARDPENGEALVALAYALSMQNKHDLAFTSARNAVRVIPDEFSAHYVIALVHANAKRLNEALSALREALRLNPLAVEAYALQARVYADLRRYDEAIAAAKRGLAYNPVHFACLTRLAIGHVAKQQNSEAETIIEQIIKAYPERETGYSLRGLLRMRRGDYKNAHQDFRESLRIQPEGSADLNDWLIETLKAQNPVYGVLLRYFQWIARISPGQKLGIFVGGLVVVQVLRSAAARSENLSGLSNLVLAVYIGFVFITWTAEPLSDLVLRLSRFGQMALPRKRKIASNWIGLVLLVALIMGAAGFALEGDAQARVHLAALQTAGLMIPMAGAFADGSPKGSPTRRFLQQLVGVMAVFTVWGLFETPGGISGQNLPFVLYLMCLAVYTWGSNFVVQSKS